MKFNTGSFCSGIGAPEVAWEALGWTPQWFSEIEPFPCAVLAHHFPSVRNLGDMTTVNGADLRGSVDIVVAGTPCQAFSVAGKRESLDDHRGNLTLVFVELVHDIDPQLVLWENVPGVLSTNDNAFGCFLAGLVGEEQPLVCRGGSWPVAGMVIGPRRTAAWRILDAQYLGLAQRRRRVFVVSCRTGDGTNPGAILFEPESLPRDIAPSRETRARVAASLTRGADSSGAGGYAGRRREDDSNIVVNALDAHMGMGGPDDNAAQANHLIAAAIRNNHHCDHDGDESRLVVTHSLRADGFDASEDGTGRGTPIVPVSFGWNKSSSQTMRTDETADALQASPTSNPAVAYQCQGTNVGPMGTLRKGNGNETAGVPFIVSSANSCEVKSHARVAEVARALDTTGGFRPQQGGTVVAFQTRFARNGRGSPESICPTLQGADAGATSDMRPCVSSGMSVRRLMPVECEKLQGFPPGYTDIIFRNKPAADGPRYRALGNSMAVPVLRWLGERIVKVMEASR